MRIIKLAIFTGLIFLNCMDLLTQDGKANSKVQIDNGNVRITGTKNNLGIVYKLEKANYLLTASYKGENIDQFDAVSTKSDAKSSILLFNGFSKDASGWCTETRIYESYLAEDDTINVESKSDWTISFEKFPLKGEALAMPANLKGSGTNISNTFALKKGNVTFSIKCPDTKLKNFRILLRDALTGEKAIMKFLSSNSKNIADGKKDFSDTQNISIPIDGRYFLEIIANGNASWEINVVQ